MHSEIAAEPMTSTWTRLGRSADFAGAGPFAASAHGFDVVVVNTANGLRAYDGRCPHQGALLGEGELSANTLVCRNHGWRFDAESGERHGGPQCLLACPLSIRGDDVWIDVSALRATREPHHLVATRQLDDLPGPKPLPLLGNMLQIDNNRLHLVLEKWAATYGQIFTYRLGPQRVLAIADATIAEQLLRDRPDTYRRPAIVEPVFREMGVAGVFSAEGVAWRAQRRLAMQALSQRQIRTSYAALRTVTGRLAQRWQQYADSGAELDVVEEMKRFTVDVTTLLVFGHDVNTIENGTDVIQRNLELVFPTFNRRLFALVPTWRWLRMPADRRVDRALAELREWLAVRVAESRKHSSKHSARAERPENFIESMLTSRDADGQPFSDEVIFGNAMTMLLAGEDTTAFTLAWAIHHLCETPHAVARLREESDAVLMDGTAPFDFEAAGRLAYAGAVANEAMRMRPVAPTIFLENIRDVIIAGVAVPARTWIVLLTRPPALEPTNFADPETFRPERWLAATQATAPHETGAHMPFGSGPRICPGRSLALLEMKLVLSMIYRSFDVERVGDAANVHEAFAFTMSPVGLKVRLRPRAGHNPNR